MRILVVTADPPSPIRVRPYEFVRALRARGNDVVLAHPFHPKAPPESNRSNGSVAAGQPPPIRRPIAPWRRLANLTGAAMAGRPMQASWAWHPALLDDIVASTADAVDGGRPFDLVHVEHLRAAEYGLALASRTEVPVVWDAVDSISRLFERSRRDAHGLRSRAVTALELPRTRSYERSLVRRFRHIIVTSDRDAAALSSLAESPASNHTSRITVVPNGVDLERFHPDAAIERKPDTIVFSGKMGYHANETAAVHLLEQIMPRVWEARPSARLVLCGARPSRALRRLAAKAAGWVIVTGAVPSVAEHVAAAAVAVAPMVYGVGIQNKVLEAMACATPVVISPAAADALAPAARDACRVASDPTAFASTVVALLGDDRARVTLGRAGRAYVETHHSWDRAAAALEDVYRAAIARPSATEAVT